MKRPGAAPIAISELWKSNDETLWDEALERYWSFVQPKNMAVERELDQLKVDSIASMDAQTWYTFLHEKYFVWKYTAPNRLATTRAHLKTYVKAGKLDELDDIRRELLKLDTDDIEGSLKAVCKIRGLGTAGGSGLLSLMYPSRFATVDQFVVKALREISCLPEHDALHGMNPEGLSNKEGAVLTSILRRKARELNQAMNTIKWNPRTLEMVLWTYGR